MDTPTPPIIYPPEVLQEPMRRVGQKLKEMGVDFKRMRALEFFAREGDWQTLSYADEVAALDAWEIDPQHEAALRRNLPRARVRIGDSYRMARALENFEQYDLIVFDNPQLVFGKNGEYCEHFEALPLAFHLLKKRGIVIFNVNVSPYHYEQWPEWKNRRDAFYGTEQTATLDLKFLENFYRNYFQEIGFKTDFIFFEKRHDGMIHYCVMGVVKRKL